MKKYICKYCSKELASKSSLNNHIKNAQYCIEKRENKEDVRIFECKYCKKTYTSNQSLELHLSKCSSKKEQEYEKQINYSSVQYEEKIKFLMEEINKRDNTIKELQDKLENIAIKAVQRPNFEDETVIDINQDEIDFLSDSDFVIEETDDEEEQKQKQLPPLEVGQGYTIEHREEDGYINVTNLCKAGDKQFKAWKRTQ